MAGMLPGVEAARRRRFHQGGGGARSSHSGSSHPSIALLSSPSSRRPSFSLFSANSASTSLSVTVQPRSRGNQIDDKLGQLATEAKERLDERLRAQRKSPIKRNNSDVSEEMTERRRRRGREMRTEVHGTKNKQRQGERGWKTWDQKECAVCLDEFKVGENLVNLPCAHTFHSRCLVPWLQTNPHCPCCRISIFE